MSTWSVLFNAGQGMQAQSTGMSAISQNLANMNTNGYKTADVTFADTLSAATSFGNLMGVKANQRNLIGAQGTIISTQNWSDAAINGRGFFVTNGAVDGSGKTLFTRDGSFNPSSLTSSSANGPGGATYLTTTSGAYVMGWAAGTKPTDSTKGLTAANYTLGSVMTAKATTNETLGANLPSDAPIYDPNNPGKGGYYATSGQVFDSMGNASNVPFTFTKTGANSWSIAASPPSGAAVATLANSSASGTKVLASEGQLQFSSVPPAGSYLTLNSTVGGTPSYVRVQFYDSSQSGQKAMDPTRDGSAYGSGASPYVLGVDLNGVKDPQQVAQKIQDAIRSAADQPGLKGTYGMSSMLLGGSPDGASRFVANNGILQIVQSPGAAAVTVDCTSSATTGLGTSVVQSGSANGQFTVQQIDSSYVQASAAKQSDSFTINGVNTGNVPGTNSFTVSANPPTGKLQVGTASLDWASIAAGGTGYPHTNATSASDIAANAAYWVTNVAGISGVTASATGSSVTVSTANPDYTNVIPDSGGATGEVKWANGTDGGSTESVSPGNVFKIGNIEIPWSQMISGQVTSYTDASTGVGATLSSPITLPYGANGTDTTALGATDTGKLASNVAAALTGLSKASVSIPGGVSATVDASNPNQVDLTSGATPTSVYVSNNDVTWADGGVGSTSPQVMGQGASYNSSVTGVTFNGDGTPASVLPNDLQLAWSNGASAQDITLDMNSMRQLASGTGQMTSMQQDGYAAGSLTKVHLDSTGVLSGDYSNGQSQALYTLAIGTFTAPDALDPVAGNSFAQTQGAGTMNINTVSDLGGQSELVVSAVEGSNVNVESQFSNMIVTQRAYEVNSQVFKAGNEMTQTARDLIT